MKLITFLLLFSYLSSNGQVDKMRLINSKTNSYIFNSGNSFDKKRQQTINYFYLVSANDEKITKKQVKIYSDKKSALFIDSLKTKGFKKYAGTTNITDQCNFTIALMSADLYRTDGSDTLFQFILAVTLIRTNGEQLSTSDTLLGDKKQEILDAIKNKKYSVRIDKINQTKLIDVTINSFVLTNPYSKAIFNAGSAYGIYFVDKKY